MALRPAAVGTAVFAVVAVDVVFPVGVVGALFVQFAVATVVIAAVIAAWLY